MANNSNGKPTYSLQRRLLLNTSIVLVFFIAAMSFILLDSYKAGIKQATYERLYAQFYSLLSYADEIEPGDLFLPEEIPSDKRFNQYNSGLSALVYDETESLIWKSLSARYDQEQHKVPLPLSLPGEATLAEITMDDTEYFRFHYIAEWESQEGKVSLYHFVILENKRPFDQVISAYRNQLWTWLSILALSLLFLLFVVMRWTLRPIRRAVKELREVEKGVLSTLSDKYPQELQRLTENINRFIKNERHQSKRYKETLGNLAHSLKTPLAVMKAALQNESESGQLERICSEQIDRMDQIVAYQLQRATSGPQVMMRSMDVDPAINKLVTSLGKVYQDKNIDFSVSVKPGLTIALNEGDFYEVFGNILDNACKWTESKVSVQAERSAGKVSITVEDNGPGIPENVRLAILSRGKRLDETVEGQGIGMSVVKEIVAAYNGKIHIDTSDLGGTLMRVSF
ncbi:ATP-binding protein [Kangiella sediminilitoris]|uniref:histidine kinase n=1 Tax=Kangiella sediminilitoris TaxID=1144748 RepID=A0A1B3BAW9_9GAMM|nr:ATP-binding protein [Kangiella sediminilitoris]AOE49904.1 Histidine kinase [Kangiella sediminilitoris]